MPISILRRFLSDSRALAAVEFAMVAPFLLFGFSGVADYGQAAFVTSDTRSAAEAGALYGSIKGYNSGAMVTAAQNASSMNLAGGNVSTTNFYACVTGSAGSATIGATQASSFLCPDGKTTSGQFATIQITPTFTPIFSGDGASVPTVKVTMRIA
jgi:Flp pilus assembly protein TadG